MLKQCQGNHAAVQSDVQDVKGFGINLHGIHTRHEVLVRRQTLFLGRSPGIVLGCRALGQLPIIESITTSLAHCAEANAVCRPPEQGSARCCQCWVLPYLYVAAAVKGPACKQHCCGDRCAQDSCQNQVSILQHTDND